MASPAVTYSSRRPNQLHSSSAERPKASTSAAARWLSWISQKRKRVRKWEGGWESTWWKKKRATRKKKKTDKDRLRPSVLLSYWPKAHPVLAATDDISVWNMVGEAGPWLPLVTLATGPLTFMSMFVCELCSDWLTSGQLCVILALLLTYF